MNKRPKGADRYRDSIEDRYFEWLIGLVLEGQRKSWRKLLMFLHETNFILVVPMDSNRACDALDLRFQFAREENSDPAKIRDETCSVLEVMVALAKRCEMHITYDEEIGDRTGIWFFRMIESLGLSAMDDEHFDKIICAEVVERFLNRQYEPNGKGGLFTVNEPWADMRDVEIWYQMMWYLNENVYGRRE